MRGVIAFFAFAGIGLLLLAGAAGCSRRAALSFDDLRGQEVRYRLFQRHQSSNYWDDGKTIPQRTGERLLAALEGGRQRNLKPAPVETAPSPAPAFIASLEATGDRGAKVHVVFCEGLKLVEYRYKQYAVPADERQKLGELLRSEQDRGRRPIR